MSQFLANPTPQQLAQVEIVQSDVAELVARQLKDGLPPAIVLAGFATALTSYQLQTFGPDRAAYWFYSNFQIIAKQMNLAVAGYSLQPTPRSDFK